jgi:hypothetical protein
MVANVVRSGVSGRIMRFFLLLTVLIVGLTAGVAAATVQSPWTDLHSPIAILLVVIMFLLACRQFRKRNSYVVEHFVDDLNFVETPNSYGRVTVRIERGPMLLEGCRSMAFLDYAAAKASFDQQEDLCATDSLRGIESIQRIYAVSASAKKKCWGP